MKFTRTRLVYLFAFVIAMLFMLTFMGLSSSASAQTTEPATQTPTTPSSLPQPPVMTNDKFLALIGQGQAQVTLLNEYTRSLESTITRLDTKIAQLEALKTPPTPIPAPCTSAQTIDKKKGK